MKLRNLVCAAALTLAGTAATAQESLSVGVTTTGVPFTFIDTSTQEPTGAMVDLAAAIAEDIGRAPEFEVMQFSGLIQGLKIGRIDLISAGMFATETRKEVVDFSDTVYSYGDAMFVAAEDETDYAIGDLEGEVVGAQIGTTFADQLQGMGTFREVKLYDSLVDIMRDVQLGRIKAGFGDKPIIGYQISQNPQLGVRMVDGYEPMSMGDVALAVSKDNPELLEQVNAAISDMKDSGELDEIFESYGL